MTKNHAVFPADCAGFLTGRLRRLFRSPERILSRYIRTGDTVLDLGCGPGFFTIPIARMVGEEGAVIAADIQGEMLSLLGRAAVKQGLVSRIRLHQTRRDSIALDLPPHISFALAFHVLHETQDPAAILSELYRIIRPGGLLLIAEPVFIVSSGEFARTVSAATDAGFTRTASPFILLSRSALMQKRDDG